MVETGQEQGMEHRGHVIHNRAVLLYACLTVCCCLPAYGLSARKRAKVRLKIATVAPERSVWGRTYKALGDEVAERTEGQVRLRVYAGGVQGDELTVIRKMRIGQLDGGGFLGRGLSLMCRDSTVTQLPLLFRSQEEVSAVIPKITPFLEEKLRENGYEVLGWPEVGFSYMFSRDPVRDLDGVGAAKPWLMKDDIFSEVFYDCAEMTAVPAEVGDVLTGLQSGLLRTVFSPPAGMVALQWHSRVSYRLDLKVAFSIGAFIVRDKKWAQLSPDAQEVVRSVSVRHVAELNRRVQNLNRDALEVMEKGGVKTLTISPEALAEFRRLNERITEKLGDTVFSPESYRVVRNALDAYRASEAGGGG